MKKLAVVGCSFTDLYPCFHPVPDDPNQTYSWLWFAVQDYPHVHFDTYASGGNGAVYFDTVLKHLVTQGYKNTLLQLTDNSRWYMPLASRALPVGESFWHTDRYADNLTQYRLKLNTVAMTGNFNIHIKLAPNSPNPDFYESKVGKGNWWGPSQLSSMYSDLFNETLHLYDNVFDKFVYFSFYQQRTNNCNLEESLYDFLTEKFGYEIFVKKYLSDDKHLNYYGAEIAYNEFIKPFVLSKIL
jgi:hypothetical protein